MRVDLLLAAVFASGVAAGGVAPAQQPPLTDLLRRGAEYLAAYAPRVSGVLLDEEYLLIEVGASGMRVPQRLNSHLLILDLYGKVMTLRDVFAVAGAPTRPPTPRISEILATPTPDTWQLAQKYAAEGHIYFLRDLVNRVSDPTLALQCLSAVNQPRFRWRLDGARTLKGTALVALHFQEQTRDARRLIRTVGSATASGRFWIDTASGAIHRTELWLEAKTETVRIDVTFASDAAVGMLLPAESVQTFDIREIGEGTSLATGGSLDRRHSIESTVKYTNPRYSPIDLSKMAR